MNQSRQKPLTALVFLASAVFGTGAFYHNKLLLIIFFIGLAMGFVISRSDICFTAMFQNIFLFRNFAAARAVLTLIIVSFIGVNLVQYFTSLNGNPLPGRFHSVGVHTAVGGLLFGFGMMLAGGCGTGTLQRIGEGFHLFGLVFLGMTVGSVIGIYHYSWWTKTFFSHKAIFISDHTGWIAGTTVSLLLLGGLYYFSLLLEKDKIGRGITNGGKKIRPLGRSLSFLSIKNTGRD